MTLFELIISVIAVVIIMLIQHALGAAERRQEAKNREYMGMITRLAWMMVDARPSKVIYFPKADVDASIDVPHLQLEITPGGYALRANTAPSQDATHAIQVNG